MKFEKRQFMGIDLDVLVGHPEHDLLFVATQVARAAGLKNPTATVGNFKAVKACDMRLSIQDVLLAYSNPVDLPSDQSGRTYQKQTTLLNEANVYRMLLRGHAPQSEPFRKWVTEEVLPTIRKTGSYNAADSKSPIALVCSALLTHRAGQKARRPDNGRLRRTIHGILSDRRHRARFLRLDV